MPPIPNQNLRKVGNLLKKLVYDEDTLAPDDRRTDSRACVAGEVVVLVYDTAGAQVGQTRVFIRDLSTNGCGLWSRSPIPAGTIIVVQFPASGRTPPMNKQGTVCHCRGQASSGFAIGVSFTATTREEAA